jgi:hypothetical protein
MTNGGDQHPAAGRQHDGDSTVYARNVEPIVPSRHRLPDEARRGRDDGIAVAESAEDDVWRATADQAIHYLASLTTDFSANDCRALGVPDPIRPRAWAGRFTAAAKAGLIEAVGATRSNRVTSHGAWLTVWRGTAKAKAAA